MGFVNPCYQDYTIDESTENMYCIANIGVLEEGISMSHTKKDPWYMHNGWDSITKPTRTEAFLHIVSVLALAVAIGFLVATGYELASPYDPSPPAVAAEHSDEDDGRISPIDPSELKAPGDYVAAVNSIAWDALEKGRAEGLSDANLRLAVETDWWKQVCSDKHSMLGEPMTVRDENDPRFKTFLSYYTTAVFDKKEMVQSEKLSMFDQSKLKSC